MGTCQMRSIGFSQLPNLPPAIVHITHPPQLTYPLDTLRLRLAVDPKLRGVGGAIAVLLKEGSGAAFYRGLGASMLGAPACYGSR